MSDDRPIKIHVDEEMRRHIEACLYHYKRDMEKSGDDLDPDMTEFYAMNEKCLREVKEAGT